jgi:uncharacterized protein (TIGR00369 family)
MSIHPRIQRIIEQDRGILEQYNMLVTAAENGRCEIELTVTPAWVNAAGFAHGSIAFSLMDTACAYAIGTTENRGVTLNANVSYLKGGKAGDTMCAQVEIASLTRRTASLRGEVFVASDRQRQLAAHGTFTFLLIDVKT